MPVSNINMWSDIKGVYLMMHLFETLSDYPSILCSFPPSGNDKYGPFWYKKSWESSCFSHAKVWQFFFLPGVV